MLTPWKKVHAEIGHQPLVAGYIGGAEPLYFERYLYQMTGLSVSELPCTGLITQFGGGRVTETSRRDGVGDVNLPTDSILIPAGVPSRWTYAGTVDFAAMYFLGEGSGVQQQLALLGQSRGALAPFSDPLVNAAALQLAYELQKGQGADDDFMARLAAIMLEQAYRVLTTPGTGGISPRHVHFPRLQAVLNHVHSHTDGDLSAENLAALAGVSLAHFRRIFHDAVGMPPHRYVLSVRLEQARKLLAMSAMPIATVAQECGFSSQSHLTASFRVAHACTPAEFRAHEKARRGQVSPDRS